MWLLPVGARDGSLEAQLQGSLLPMPALPYARLSSRLRTEVGRRVLLQANLQRAQTDASSGGRAIALIVTNPCSRGQLCAVLCQPCRLSFLQIGSSYGMHVSRCRTQLHCAPSVHTWSKCGTL